MDIEAIKAKYLVNDVRDPMERRAKISALYNKSSKKADKAYKDAAGDDDYSFRIGVKATVVDYFDVLANSKVEAKKKAKELFRRKNPKLNIINIEA